MAERRLTALVRTLHDAGIEFLVVGGLAAVLNGAPVNTFDVDVVHRRTPENVDRLIPLLESLDAVYRIQPARRLRPVRSALLSSGHQNLLTRYGPLDLLGEIGNGLGYEELLPRSKEILIAENVRVRILNLETLIEVKEQLNGEKDRAVLPLLRSTLERQKQNRHPDEL
jgi:predicted nucleotidyltransferase